MRNQEYRDDQKVFSFINSQQCETYTDLTNFLVKNNLPLIERWVFYFFGKRNWINHEVISKMDNDDFDEYGGLINGSIYHWREYMRDEKRQKKLIKENLISRKEKHTDEIIQEIFIKMLGIMFPKTF